MKKYFRVLPVLLLVMTVSMVSQAADNSKKEAAAIQAATDWLQLTDNGKYAESWETAATTFRNLISKEKWVNALKQVRSPLGKLLSRKVKSATYTRTLPGAPDGQYVVIRFETSFANKKSAIETVTPLIDTDGNWHVSGYFIR